MENAILPKLYHISGAFDHFQKWKSTPFQVLARVTTLPLIFISSNPVLYQLGVAFLLSNISDHR
jgi:hypothetical protein